MKHILFLLLFSCLAFVPARAQQVTFFSEGFDLGVRSHLGLSASDPIDQARTDTITMLDLSGLSISDLRDIKYLPNIQILDLSCNLISRISDLCILEKLSVLNLESNQITDLSPLAFSQAESIHLYVAFNHLVDYDASFLLNKTQFLIDGLDSQSIKDAPYLDVSNFITEIDEETQQHAILFRAYTNLENNIATIQCGNASISHPADGSYGDFLLNRTFDEVTPVVCTLGNLTETTYVVPVRSLLARTGGKLTIKTELPPDSYNILYASALSGSVSTQQDELIYESNSEGGDTDVISYSFGQGWTEKGRSIINIETVDISLGDVDIDGDVDEYDIDALIMLMMGKFSSSASARNLNISMLAADVNEDGSIDVADITALVNILHPAAKE